MPLNDDDDVECPHCCGDGEEMDYARIHSRSMEPPYRLCSYCGGSGTVSTERAGQYDRRVDYDAEERAERAIRRWEEECER